MALPVVLFIDEVCNKPYDPHVLATQALGGTEATVVRVAEGLAATGLFSVAVQQHCRVLYFDEGDVVYRPIGDTMSPPDYVISLRSPETLRKAKERFPRARHYLWNHDLCSAETARDMVKQSDFTTIAVSNFHKTQIQDTLYPQGYSGQFPVKVIYNPISDDLAPDSTPVDPNKLLWISSPHKGIDYALAVFKNLLSFNPDFRLYIANPGYLPNYEGVQQGVTTLGALPHADVIHHLRNSLCLFYPNIVFPETFGLCFSEPNAVGTPVLTHPIGAAREVLFHPSETLDCRNVRSVIDRVMAWHSGNRPKVKANPKFRLSSVIASWRRLLNV
jgi:glycosyltransferase involved in cell wall biosynthesis